MGGGLFLSGSREYLSGDSTDIVVDNVIRQRQPRWAGVFWPCDTERIEMTDARGLDPLLIEAIEKIETFVTQTTGVAPTDGEISSALTRYFVLKEIADFIILSREGSP